MSGVRKHVDDTGLLEGPAAFMHQKGCIAGQCGWVARYVNNPRWARQTCRAQHLRQRLSALARRIDQNTVERTQRLPALGIDLEQM